MECYSEHYNLFKGRSERFIKLATKEITRRKKLHAKKFNISATDIARLIQSAELEEALLKQQLADNQQKYILQIINNDPVSAPLLLPSVPETKITANTFAQTDSSEEISIISDSIKPTTYKTFEEAFYE